MSSGNQRSANPYQSSAVYWPAARGTQMCLPLSLKVDVSPATPCRVEIPTPEQALYQQRWLLEEGIGELMLRLDPHLYADRPDDYWWEEMRRWQRISE